MRREPNPDLDSIVLEALAEKYHLLQKREGIHLSTLVYCLTAGYLNQTAPLPPTDTELLLFATGYGLEAELTHSSAVRPVLEKDGILYRPDNVIPSSLPDDMRGLIEIKSTRAGVKKYQVGDLPETWITYMKGGCYIMGKDRYNLCVIYVAERPAAAILSEVIYFEKEEIEENWKWLLERRDLFKTALKTETVPIPYTTAPEWLCRNCRYSTICSTIVLLEGKK